ncbi:unnamed protein product, partial [Prorocentrum cordatum]
DLREETTKSLKATEKIVVELREEVEERSTKVSYPRAPQAGHASIKAKRSDLTRKSAFGFLAATNAAIFLTFRSTGPVQCQSPIAQDIMCDLRLQRDIHVQARRLFAAVGRARNAVSG